MCKTQFAEDSRKQMKDEIQFKTGGHAKEDYLATMGADMDKARCKLSAKK